MHPENDRKNCEVIFNLAQSGFQVNVYLKSEICVSVMNSGSSNQHITIFTKCRADFASQMKRTLQSHGKQSLGYFPVKIWTLGSLTKLNISKDCSGMSFIILLCLSQTNM